MSGGGCSIVWFRRDLRVEDNPALAAGVRAGAVIALFVWAPEEEGHYYPGRVSRWWLKHSLAHLDSSLRSFGTSLITKRSSDSVSCLLEVIKSTGATQLFFNHLYGINDLYRDGLAAFVAPKSFPDQPATTEQFDKWWARYFSHHLNVDIKRCIAKLEPPCSPSITPSKKGKSAKKEKNPSTSEQQTGRFLPARAGLRKRKATSVDSIAPEDSQEILSDPEVEPFALALVTEKQKKKKGTILSSSAVSQPTIITAPVIISDIDVNSPGTTLSGNGTDVLAVGPEAACTNFSSMDDDPVVSSPISGISPSTVGQDVPASAPFSPMAVDRSSVLPLDDLLENLDALIAPPALSPFPNIAVTDFPAIRAQLTDVLEVGLPDILSVENAKLAADLAGPLLLDPALSDNEKTVLNLVLELPSQTQSWLQFNSDEAEADSFLTKMQTLRDHGQWLKQQHLDLKEKKASLANQIHASTAAMVGLEHELIKLQERIAQEKAAVVSWQKEMADLDHADAVTNTLALHNFVKEFGSEKKKESAMIKMKRTAEESKLQTLDKLKPLDKASF